MQPAVKQTSLYSTYAAPPVLNRPRHATTSPIIPFSGYAAAPYQTLAGNHVLSEASAFMQDNARWETSAEETLLPMPSSYCIPQSTILPQTSPSLSTESSSSAFVAVDLLFQQQCYAVGQEIFPVENQPELSKQRELFQNRLSLNGESDETFSSSISIVSHLDASNESLSQGQTVFNGEQLPQQDDVDLVVNTQKPKLRDYGPKRTNNASATARSSRTSKPVKRSVKAQFREGQIKDIQTIDQVSSEIRTILQILTLSLRLRRSSFGIQSQENCKGQLLFWAPNKEFGQS